MKNEIYCIRKRLRIFATNIKAGDLLSNGTLRTMANDITRCDISIPQSCSIQMAISAF